MDLGLVGAPFGALLGHSANKHRTERASILGATAKYTGGRKRKPFEEFVEAVEKIPQFQRTFVWRVAALTGLQKSTVHCFLRRSEASRSALWTSPRLTPEKKPQRLQFVANQVQTMGRSFVLDPCINWVHIDENGFTFKLMAGGCGCYRMRQRKGIRQLRIKGLYPRLCFLLWWAVLISDLMAPNSMASWAFDLLSPPRAPKDLWKIRRMAIEVRHAATATTAIST